MIVSVTLRSTARIIPASGWRRLRRDTNRGVSSTFSQTLYYRVARSSEPRSYRFAFGRRVAGVVALVAFSGADATSPINASSGTFNANTNRIRAPSVTTVAGAHVIGFFANTRMRQTRPPSGMVELFERRTGSRYAITAEAAHYVAPAAGPTRARTAISSGRNSSSVGQLVAIRPAAAPGPQGGRTALRWVLTGANMKKIRDADPALAAYAFDTPLAYATGNEHGTQNQVPAGYAAVPTLKYESYTAFKSDVESGHIDSSIKAVNYNPERWSLTPVAEQRDPARYMARFGQIAHQYGYYAITSPGRTLMQVDGALCRAASGETLSEAFVRCNIAGAAARHVDMYRVQAQVHEADPARYRWFVQSTEAQARAANPSVVFLSNLATSPEGTVATPQMLFDAHNAVNDLVSGHYVSINSEEIDVAIAFLRMVRAAGR